MLVPLLQLRSPFHDIASVVDDILTQKARLQCDAIMQRISVLIGHIGQTARSASKGNGTATFGIDMRAAGARITTLARNRLSLVRVRNVDDTAVVADQWVLRIRDRRRSKSRMGRGVACRAHDRADRS
jgi:hypothetical protein